MRRLLWPFTLGIGVGLGILGFITGSIGVFGAAFVAALLSMPTSICSVKPKPNYENIARLESELGIVPRSKPSPQKVAAIDDALATVNCTRVERKSAEMEDRWT